MYAFVQILSLCCILKQAQMFVQLTMAAQNCVWLFQTALCVYVALGILCRVTKV
jgi:hypothetical protein